MSYTLHSVKLCLDRLLRLEKLVAPAVILERERRLLQKRAWLLPEYMPAEEFDPLMGTANPLLKVCDWYPIEKDSNIYNTCKEGEEFHLTEGMELWPYCHLCGGKIEVVTDTDDDDLDDGSAPTSKASPE
jgi:hypothetical protein